MTDPSAAQDQRECVVCGQPLTPEGKCPRPQETLCTMTDEGPEVSSAASLDAAYARAARFGWLPLRWSSVWCLVGLHNPVYSFDHDAQRPGLACWGCRRRLT